MDVNPDKLNSFIGKMLGDVGAAMNASLMLIGDKLGLYKTLAAKGSMNSSELAKATGTSERYVRDGSRRRLRPAMSNTMRLRANSR